MSTRVPKRGAMRAAVVRGPREVRIETVPVPAPGPGEVRFRVEGCGVCASNLAVWQGSPWTSYPTEPGALGHEAWGVVDLVGPGVKGVAPGDRVAAISHRAYAEYDVAPARGIVPLPAPLGDEPFPGEAFGSAMNVFRRSEIRAGHTVAVIGVGFIGSLLARLASHAGARVIAVSRRPFSLDLARKMGAEEAIPMAHHLEIVDRVRELTQGRWCDRVIEAVGKQWPLDLAAEITAERGRLVIAGYHQDGPRHVNLQLWNWRGIDVVNAHERDVAVYAEGVRSALDAVESGVFRPSDLVTHCYPLEKLAHALDDTRDRPDGFLKAVVIP